MRSMVSAFSSESHSLATFHETFFVCDGLNHWNRNINYTHYHANSPKGWSQLIGIPGIYKPFYILRSSEAWSMTLHFT